MKFLFILFFCCIFSVCQAQKNTREKRWLNSILARKELSKVDHKVTYKKFNFSKLYLTKSIVYGFVGPSYSRLSIKIKSVTKDSSLQDVYHVEGTSKVGSNFLPFTGIIKIKGIRLYKSQHLGIDEEYKNQQIRQQGLIFGNYIFSEKLIAKDAGKFTGVTVSQFYIDKHGVVKYDNIDLNADGYTNNEFVGIWQCYFNKISKVCNWGDYRIPLSGDLDIGAGEFSVNPKYKNFGWQDLKY